MNKVGFLNKTIQRKKSEKIQNEKDFLCSKYEGALIGALVGDCVGKSLEGIWGPNLNEMLEELRIAKEKCLDEVEIETFKCYSDDTALTRSICESLLNKEDFDIEDIVNSFLQTYYQDTSRGFSSASITLFKKLSQLKTKNEIQNRCLIPAMELFDGNGSFGSGGALRCSPIALYTFLKPLDEMKLECELLTRITHTHKWAILGSLLQCFAIRLALQANKFYAPFDLDTFYHHILYFVYDLEMNYEYLDNIKMENIEKLTSSLKKNVNMYLDQKKIWSKENKQNQMSFNNLNKLSYTHLLLKLYKIIKRCRRGQRINMQYLHRILSSYNSSAIQSVPLALFSFMIAIDPKCSNEVNFKLNTKQALKQYTSIERVIFYAVSFGGEAQKVASMAGAIAGAYYSSDLIPKYLVDICESSEQVKNYAKQLFDLTFKNDFFLDEQNVNFLSAKLNIDLLNSDEVFL